MNVRSLALGALLLSACQAAPSGSVGGASGASVGVELRELPSNVQLPEGTDALPLRRFSLRVGGASRDLPPALGAALQGEDAVVWLADHRLARFPLTGPPTLLAREVGSPPWVGSGLIVYARDVGADVTLIARRGDVETPLAEGLASAGSFRVEGGRVLFVGSVNGGVAGLWVASVDGAPGRAPQARCLTNCELRVGRPWGDAYVPPPPSADALELNGDIVSYSVDGRRVSRRLP